MSDLDAALARISELEDECIRLSDKVLYMLPVIDAARDVWGSWGTVHSKLVRMGDALKDFYAAYPAPQPRQPASADSNAVPDVQPTEAA